jgi:hypothetical protein
MRSRFARSWPLWLLLAAATAALAIGCRMLSGPEYEYEEMLSLDIDGSATVDVSGSIASLVALHGADLDPDPRAEPDEERVRGLFAASGIEVSSPTFYRRGGRRFVHVRLGVEDVRHLSRASPFSASTYRLERSGDVFVYRQRVRTRAPDPSWRLDAWTGAEVVAYRMHAPSRVRFENASSDVMRGNLLVWEQRLPDRMAGAPLELHVEMETESILATTLLLFASTVAAAGGVLVLAVWWTVRRGRRAAVVTAPARSPRRPR